MKRENIENFVFSVGAAIVILGALGKLIHASWGQNVLIVGMLTEVLIFLYMGFTSFKKEQIIKTNNSLPKISIDTENTINELSNSINELTNKINNLKNVFK